MRTIIETIFNTSYLLVVICSGIYLLSRSKDKKILRLFSYAILLLGIGDAFHLVPRVYSLLVEPVHTALGIGKLITSVTSTIFYILLYHILQMRYRFHNPGFKMMVYIFSGIRLVLCFLPQNEWLSSTPSVTWGIIRNVPFLLLGILLISLWYKHTHKNNEQVLRWMWLAMTLSFGFYIPVVIWAAAYPMIGLLMIPKTLAYLWIVWMALRLEISMR